MDFAALIIGMSLGLLLGAGATFFWFWSRGGQPTSVDALQETVVALNRQIAAAEAQRDSAQSVARGHEDQCAALRAQLDSEMRRNAELAARSSALETEKRALEEQIRMQRESLEEFRRQTKLEFETLASSILDSKSKIFTEQAEKNLETLLKPLREKLSSFEQRVENSYTSEAKERFALKVEIERLIGLNERMTKETQSLTQALRGDSKVQGYWGELILERILEESGLREGFEYTTQRGLENEGGDRYRPDVIINLPEDKHIVVDSKVSLTAFDLYMRCETEDQRCEALSAHLKSLQKHIDDLAEKHYSRLKGLRSPDFVFLFVPIEPAYLVAMQEDSGLADRAWKKGIALVTATTLFTSLKTVARVWQVENQNKNALEIAQEAARLYDKFVGFVDDFERLGKLFEQGSSLYGTALGKLRDGNGAVMKKIERLRELGAAPTKRIRNDLLES